MGYGQNTRLAFWEDRLLRGFFTRFISFAAGISNYNGFWRQLANHWFLPLGINMLVTGHILFGMGWAGRCVYTEFARVAIVLGEFKVGTLLNLTAGFVM